MADIKLLLRMVDSKMVVFLDLLEQLKREMDNRKTEGQEEKQMQLTKNEPAEIFSAIPVRLTFVHSARNFFVQLEPKKMDKFYLSFNDYYIKLRKKINLLHDEYIVGNNFAYYYAQDRSFYRVKLLEVDKDQIRIFFFDHGDIMCGLKKYLYRLLPEYEKTQPFARNCFVNSSWTEDFKKVDSALMSLLSDDKEMRAHFFPPIENHYPVSFTIQTDHGSQDLIEYGSKAEILDHFISSAFDYKAFFVENKCEFIKNLIIQGFTILDKNNAFSKERKTGTSSLVKILNINNFLVTDSPEELNSFVTNFSSFHSSPTLEPKKNVNTNDLVTFKHQGFFFRGLVLESQEWGYVIMSIDLGFTLFKTNDEIYPLLDMFSLKKIQPFLMLCAMHNLVPIQEKCKEFAMRQFKGLLRGTFSITVKAVCQGKFQVEIMAGKRDVSASLLKWGYAEPE